MQAGALPFRRCGRGCVCGTNMLKAALDTVSGLKFTGSHCPAGGVSCKASLAWSLWHTQQTWVKGRKGAE